jgi:hypothetical protein
MNQMGPLRRIEKTNKLATLILQFPKNNTEIAFLNWTTDDLPTKIKGKAVWTEHKNPKQSSYYIHIGHYHYTVKYINNKWYHTSWEAETYHAQEDGEVPNCIKCGLGTKENPFLSEGDIECVHSKKSDDTEPTTESKTDTELSEDQDTPVIT